MILTFDIETLPCNDAEVIADMEKTIAPPGNIKLQASIDKWMDENKEQAVKDLVSKTSFDGLMGRIACISWAIDDHDIQSTSATDTEYEAIAAFYDAIDDAAQFKHPHGSSKFEVVFCGHNLAGFDLPFLKHRSIIHKIKPPQELAKAMNAKPWDGCIADTMLMWSSDSQKRASMDKLCRAFGIQGKDGFDGSMVAETWPVNPQKVIDYCKDDVNRTREIYKRITFAS